MENVVTCILLIAIGIVLCFLLYIYVINFLHIALVNKLPITYVVPLDSYYVKSNDTLRVYVYSRIDLGSTCNVCVENMSYIVERCFKCSVEDIGYDVYVVSCSIVLRDGYYFLVGECNGYLMYLGYVVVK